MYQIPKEPLHAYKEPIGEYGAVRHKGGAMYAMVDGHVKWLKPTQLRLPLQGYGCQQGEKTQLQWKGPATAPYFSVEH
jgi:prepilin-type processing-associated H-X9-DG protein